ncbi:hypothetical protein Salat_0144500 [Sesamum alatum]|uniref:Uncharacterized protein n=1 Tax=Sesamum alatum TaxID=300844 RepID=A0AAE1YX91_9LAMI|nr:hypothetical protein Salat_0144500 [Sesamum alatum]
MISLPGAWGVSFRAEFWGSWSYMEIFLQDFFMICHILSCQSRLGPSGLPLILFVVEVLYLTSSIYEALDLRCLVFGFVYENYARTISPDPFVFSLAYPLLSPGFAIRGA